MKEERSVRKVLGPSERFEIAEMGCDAIIYPMGLTHLSEFSSQLSRGFAIAAKLAAVVDKQGSQEEVGRQVLAQLVPLIMKDAIDLADSCVRFDFGPTELPEEDVPSLKTIPHWIAAPILEKWVIMSFGEEKKWRPWVAAIENTIKQFSGKDFSLLTLMKTEEILKKG